MWDIIQHDNFRKMKGGRTSERNLIIPALTVLFNNGGNEHIVETKILTSELRKHINPTHADQELLKGRSDDRLSQVIRNLVSHRTLEKQGLALYQVENESKEKGYKLTKKGIMMLRQNEVNLYQLRLPFEDY